MNPRLHNQTVTDVAWLIRQSGKTARLFRPAKSPAGAFFGTHETADTELSELPIEMKDLPPEDLTEIGADAVASVLPNCGVQEQDFLKVGETRYRVTEVKPQNLFGAVTHLDLHLELEKREGGHG